MAKMKNTSATTAPTAGNNTGLGKFVDVPSTTPSEEPKIYNKESIRAMIQAARENVRSQLGDSPFLRHSSSFFGGDTAISTGIAAPTRGGSERSGIAEGLDEVREGGWNAFWGDRGSERSDFPGGEGVDSLFGEYFIIYFLSFFVCLFERSLLIKGFIFIYLLSQAVTLLTIPKPPSSCSQTSRSTNRRARCRTPQPMSDLRPPPSCWNPSCWKKRHSYRPRRS